MTSARPRRALHPVVATAVLLALAAVGALLAARLVGGALLLLTVVAGAAAGFANSGST